MSKEIKDIAMWEETDSELAKKNILELSSSIKYHIDFNKKLIDEITRLNMIIDIKKERIDELNKRLDKKDKRIDKANNKLEKLQKNLMEILNLGIPIKDITDIQDILRGENNDSKRNV